MTLIHLKLFLALLLASPLFLATDAQDVYPSQVLFSGLEEEASEFGEAGGDYFGQSVAIDGTTLVVGTPFCIGCDPSHPGKLLVYERDDELGEWVLQQTLNKPTDMGIAGSFIHFGKNIAFAGNTIAATVYEVDTRTWHIILFGLLDSQWEFTQAIVPLTTIGDVNNYVTSRFELTESVLVANVEDKGMVVYGLSGPGQVDLASEQILGPFPSGFIAHDDYIFASDDGLTVYKKNLEGIYVQQESLVDDSFDFGRLVSVSGTTLAVAGSENELDEDDYFAAIRGDVRLYSFATGSLELQGSIDAGVGVYERISAIAMGSDGLLVMVISYDDGHGVRYYGLDGNTFGDPEYIISADRPAQIIRDVAVSDETIVVGGAPYNGPAIGSVLVIDRREGQAPTAAPTNQPASTRVRKFILFETDNDTRIATLEDGAVFDRKDIGRALNIRAATDGPVESVVFTLNGDEYSTGERFPYMLRSSSGDPNDFRRVPELASGGTFTVTATPYSGPGGTGTAGTPASVTFVLN